MDRGAIPERTIPENKFGEFDIYLRVRFHPQWKHSADEGFAMARGMETRRKLAEGLANNHYDEFAGVDLVSARFVKKPEPQSGRFTVHPSTLGGGKFCVRDRLIPSMVNAHGCVVATLENEELANQVVELLTRQADGR